MKMCTEPKKTKTPRVDSGVTTYGAFRRHASNTAVHFSLTDGSVRTHAVVIRLTSRPTGVFVQSHVDIVSDAEGVNLSPPLRLHGLSLLCQLDKTVARVPCYLYCVDYLFITYVHLLNMVWPATAVPHDLPPIRDAPGELRNYVPALENACRSRERALSAFNAAISSSSSASETSSDDSDDLDFLDTTLSLIA